MGGTPTPEFSISLCHFERSAGIKAQAAPTKQSIQRNCGKIFILARTDSVYRLRGRNFENKCGDRQQILFVVVTAMPFEKYILTFLFMSCNIVMYKNLRMCASAYIRITPKPEVEIMMRNKKELKGFLLTATRLIVLALVFVTAFTVALTSDFVGSIDDGDVVLAADQHVKDGNNENTFGKANPILPDQGAITAESFDFPNIVSPWIFTATYYNVVPYNNQDNDNDSRNNVEIYKNDGNTDLFLRVNAAKNWEGSITDGRDKNE